MAVLSFSPPPPPLELGGPPSKRLRIGSMTMMSGGASGNAAKIATATRATPSASSSSFSFGVAMKVSRAAAMTAAGSAI